MKLLFMAALFLVVLRVPMLCARRTRTSLSSHSSPLSLFRLSLPPPLPRALSAESSPTDSNTLLPLIAMQAAHRCMAAAARASVRRAGAASAAVRRSPASMPAAVPARRAFHSSAPRAAIQGNVKPEGKQVRRGQGGESEAERISGGRPTRSAAAWIRSRPPMCTLNTPTRAHSKARAHVLDSFLTVSPSPSLCLPLRPAAARTL